MFTYTDFASGKQWKSCKATYSIRQEVEKKSHYEYNDLNANNVHISVKTYNKINVVMYKSHSGLKLIKVS